MKDCDAVRAVLLAERGIATCRSKLDRRPETADCRDEHLIAYHRNGRPRYGMHYGCLLRAANATARGCRGWQDGRNRCDDDQCSLHDTCSGLRRAAAGEGRWGMAIADYLDRAEMQPARRWLETAAQASVLLFDVYPGSLVSMPKRPVRLSSQLREAPPAPVSCTRHR